MHFLSCGLFDGCVVVALDLSKAFDKVNHAILYSKLKSTVPASFTNLIFNYLYQRTVHVKIQNKETDTFYVKNGVPQGSVFGPCLFNLFIADFVPLYNTTEIIKYADDITLIIPYSSDHLDNVTAEIKHFKMWCSCNKMEVNDDKTQVMPILKRNVMYKYSDNFKISTSLKILGITFSKNLHCTQHFNEVCGKASRNIYLLKRLSHICSRKDLYTIYRSKILSIISYGLPLFTNITQSSLDQIKRVNKKCHTIICSDDPCCCDTLDIQLMQKKQILRLIKKLTIINTPLSSLFPNKSKTGRYILPRAKTTRKVKSFIFKACQVFNANFSRS